jgi:hypothetical protein
VAERSFGNDTKGHGALLRWAARYERKLWMRDLVMGVAYPPADL